MRAESWLAITNRREPAAALHRSARTGAPPERNAPFRLLADAQQQLRWFVGKMQPYPKAMFLVQGFADSTGSETKNVQLSDERAASVKSYLASQGIDPARMVAQGFGTQSPAAANTTAEGGETTGASK